VALQIESHAIADFHISGSLHTFGKRGQPSTWIHVRICRALHSIRATLIIGSRPTLIFVFHPPTLSCCCLSTMNGNDEEDETAIIVATAVVAILYTTVPEKEKRVALVFDQHLCWNNAHSLKTFW
jgi:hypothetical protein